MRMLYRCDLSLKRQFGAISGSVVVGPDWGENLAAAAIEQVMVLGGLAPLGRLAAHGNVLYTNSNKDTLPIPGPCLHL